MITNQVQFVDCRQQEVRWTKWLSTLKQTMREHTEGNAGHARSLLESFRVRYLFFPADSYKHQGEFNALRNGIPST